MHVGFHAWGLLGDPTRCKDLSDPPRGGFDPPVRLYRSVVSCFRSKGFPDVGSVGTAGWP